MPIGWIDVVANNTDRECQLKSVDDFHNGRLVNGSESLELDGGAYRLLRANTVYNAQWCGIPWYYSGLHYKSFKNLEGKDIFFYQSQVDGTNSIMFEYGSTRRHIARIAVSKAANFHCYMRYEEDGVFFDINNDDGTTVEALQYFENQLVKWVPIALKALGILLGKGGGKCWRRYRRGRFKPRSTSWQALRKGLLNTTRCARKGCLMVKWRSSSHRAHRLGDRFVPVWRRFQRPVGPFQALAHCSLRSH